MPTSSPTTAEENFPRGILLVEEYSALGVAISSALRKFAPLHAIQVAGGFDEAETIAAAMRPELFVLDLDPPPSGEIEFFDKLKREYPEARVLVIAAGTSRELRAERGTTGAIQFIEKPFDLAEFGAAVQALLGPWALLPSPQVRGTLRDLHSFDIVQLKCLAGSSAVVRVETSGRFGEICFQKGQIIHAETGVTFGVAALEEILSWPEGTLGERDLPVERFPHSIEAPWDVILLQVLRKLPRQARPPPAAARQAAPAARKGKKILVIDDTEMLLIFVADVLETAGQDFRVQTAPTGGAGIELARSTQPDLVLLDYSLTDMTGDKVCGALRDDPRTASIPILMMSGHLIELAKTAEEYENVVATLPKPFLSGALMSEVGRVLAAGPLSKVARAKPPGPVASQAVEPTPAPPVPAAAPPPPPPNKTPVVPSASLSTNGHGAKKTMAPPPPETHTPSPTQPSPGVGPTELSVTLALKVIAVQFNPSLQMESATLELFDRTAAVKMSQETTLEDIPLESGFRIDKVTLNAQGQIDTMHLVPTRQPPQLPFPNNSFRVGPSRLEWEDSEPRWQIDAPSENSMRVRLSADFALLAVELSVGFEVAALLLQARGPDVLLRNAPAQAGRRFRMGKVQLDQSQVLRNIIVKRTP